MPAGTFITHAFEWEGQAGSLDIRHRIWYPEASYPLPIAREDHSIDPPWRFELLSATWLPPGSGTADPAEEAGLSGPTFLYRGGAGRDGRAAETPEGVSISQVPLHWHMVLPDDLTSPPLLAGDLLFLGDDQGVLWAWDAPRGELAWTFDTGRPIVAAPAVAGGIVYVAARDRLYALEAQEGLYLWSTTVEDVISASPLIVDDLLLFGAEDGIFYALDARRGTPRWRFSAGTPIVGAAAADEGTVYFGTMDGLFYALQTARGSLRWQVSLGAAVLANPTVSGGLVYVGLSGTATGGQVVALDLDTGASRWTATAPGGVSSALAVDDALVYAATSIGTVVALDRRTGHEHWHVRLEEGVANAPLVLGESLILADTSGVVHILDKATGREIVSRSDLNPLGAPPVYGRELLFLVDRHRQAYAFHLGGPEPRPLRFSLRWDKLLADPERLGVPGITPVGWADQILVLLDNGDLWRFDPATGAGGRLVGLGGIALYPPLVLGDRAYVSLVEDVEGRGLVLALDLAGQEPATRILWQVALDGPLYSPLALADGTILACASTPEGGVLRALGAEDGAYLWGKHSFSCNGAPVADGNRVYLVDGTVQAVDVTTGQLLWQSPELAAGGTPALCGEALYVGVLGETGPVLAALERSSGQLLWRGEERVAFPFSRPACDLAAGQILVGGLDGRVLALDAAAGTLRWAHQVGEAFVSDLVVQHGIVYGVTGQGTLVALEADSGRLLARYTPPYAESSRAAPLVLGNRTFLVDGLFLYALEVVP